MGSNAVSAASRGRESGDALGACEAAQRDEYASVCYEYASVCYEYASIMLRYCYVYVSIMKITLV